MTRMVGPAFPPMLRRSLRTAYAPIVGYSAARRDAVSRYRRSLTRKLTAVALWLIRSFQEQLAEVDALSLLESAKQQYDGVARLGIEAMQLKFIGLSNTDIAAHYGIKANYLGAAVHRAAERLKSNKEFLQSLEYEPMKKGPKAS
mgnify:CR=1 FL=1